MDAEIRFRKSGKEIKGAIGNRVSQLQQRLAKRNAVLNDFMRDTRRLRSYLVRSAQPVWAHQARSESTLFGKDDISSEEKEEIAQLCRRIYEIEQELHRLALVATHLTDKQVFDLTLEELVAYGFEASIERE
jgi:hypothetical protein